MKKHMLLLAGVFSLSVNPVFAGSISEVRNAVREAAATAGVALAPAHAVMPVHYSQKGQIAADSADAVLADAETVAEAAAFKVAAVSPLTAGSKLDLSAALTLIGEVQKALSGSGTGSAAHKALLNRAAADLAQAAAAIRSAREGSLIGASSRSNLRSESVPTTDDRKLELATALTKASVALLSEAGK